VAERSRIRASFLARLRGRRDVLALAVAVLALVLGIALSILALIPEIELAETATITGAVPAVSRENVSRPFALGLIEVALESGNCTVFVTALDATQWAAYLASGDLPEPQISCRHRNASFGHPVRGIIIENRGLRNESYRVLIRAFAVRTPLAIVAVGAVPLMLGGFCYLTLSAVRATVHRFVSARQGEKKG